MSGRREHAELLRREEISRVTTRKTCAQKGITLKNRLNSHDLKREIGFFSATILVIANMVGTGIFFVVSLSAQDKTTRAHEKL
jgi:hypothetical protein